MAKSTTAAGRSVRVAEVPSMDKVQAEIRTNLQTYGAPDATLTGVVQALEMVTETEKGTLAWIATARHHKAAGGTVRAWADETGSNRNSRQRLIAAGDLFEAARKARKTLRLGDAVKASNGRSAATVTKMVADYAAGTDPLAPVKGKVRGSSDEKAARERKRSAAKRDLTVTKVPGPDQYGAVLATMLANADKITTTDARVDIRDKALALAAKMDAALARQGKGKRSAAA